MDYLIWFIIIFVIIFLFYLLFNKRKLKKEKYHKMGEINYLIIRYKLDKEKVDYKVLSHIVALANAFIISFVGTILTMIKVNYLWRMLIGAFLIIITIIVIYGFIGRNLKNKIGSNK